MFKKRLVVSTVSAVAAILATTGIVFAVWHVSGSGSGGGAAAVANGLTITALVPSNPAASMYPGGPAGSVYFQVANPNPFAVTITGLSWGTPVSLNPTSCASANVTLDAAAPTTVSISIPANATAGAYSEPNVLDLSHAAPDGCQGVGFSIPVTVTATQQ